MHDQYYCSTCQKPVEPTLRQLNGEVVQHCPDCGQVITDEPPRNMQDRPIGFGQIPRSRKRGTRGWG